MIEEQEILEKYPRLLTKNTAFYIENGWFDLVDTMLYVIQKHIEHTRYNRLAALKKRRSGQSVDVPEATKFVLHEVKQKFGTMRIHYVYGDDYIDGIVSMVETMASKICCGCGVSSNLHRLNNGVYMTYCPECEKKYLKECGQD